MKPIISLLLLFGNLFAVHAQVVNGDTNTIIDGPAIQVESSVCDLGEIMESAGVKAKFRIINTGNEPLVIRKVLRYCSGTMIQYPLNPIKPGDEGYITVTYNFSGRPGIFTKSLTVKHNAGGGDLHLIIKGRVIKAPIRD